MRTDIRQLASYTDRDGKGKDLSSPAYNSAAKVGPAKEKQCFYCGKTGHLAAQCDQPKKDRTGAPPKKPAGGADGVSVAGVVLEIELWTQRGRLLLISEDEKAAEVLAEAVRRAAKLAPRIAAFKEAPAGAAASCLRRHLCFRRAKTWACTCA